jgi:hypothetical protein
MVHSLIVKTQLLIAVFISGYTFAQPSNDDCSGATTLTVNPNYLCGSTTPGTVLNATASTQSTAACFGTENDDVWYKFTATNTTHSIDILNIAGSTTDMYHSLWSGTCPSLTLVAGTCSDPNSQVVTGLTIGQTYFLRVYTWSSTTGATSTFNVCIGTPPPPPTNDNCAGAITLTVNPNYLCGSTTPGTVASATASTQSAAACGGTENDDVWFKFTATNTTHSIDILNITGSTTDMYHSLWSGTCPSLNLVAGTCSDPNSQVVTGLTIGQTYFLRVYTWGSTAGATSSFDICIGTPPPPPVNDDCSGAITLTVNPNYLCGSTTPGTVASATASTQSAAACGGTENDDVWFKFTATNTSHSIDILNIIGSTTDMYHSLWSGSCPSLNLVAGTCSDPNSQVVTGLTIGQTYFLRVYTWSSTAGATSSFDICIGTPPPPPVNDDCAGAITLTVNPNNLCGITTPGTISSATPSSQNTTACGGTENDDVWFSFTATNTNHYIDILNVTGSTTDMYHSLWSGSCPSLTLVAGTCSDPNSQLVSGLTVGQVYFIRVYSWSSTNGASANFDVCVGVPPPPPSNDNCTGAIALTVNPDELCGTTTSGSTTSATASSQDPSACFGTENDDVWYSFVATSNTHSISLLNVTGSTTDMYHSIWTGTCPSLTLVAGTCSDPNSQSVSGLTIGQTYFVRVNTYSSTTNANTLYNICIGTPPPTGPCGNAANNDFCSNPATLTQGTGSWSSTTSNTYSADVPSGLNFCGSIENNSWYQFTALSTTETFNFSNVTNCSSNWGIQAEVYSVTTSGLGCCTGFSSVSNCMNPGVNTNGTVTASGLTIGNQYILMVDGWGGDQCQFTVNGWTGINILPVEMINFNAVSHNGYNLVTWQTISEKENDYFEIFKSIDGEHFRPIGVIEGSGNSNTTLNYQHIDTDIHQGIVYYYLKQFDFNGISSTSKTITIENNDFENGIIAIYPSPANNVINVEVCTNYSLSNALEIIDANGTILKTIDVPYSKNSKIGIKIDDLSNGFYFIRYQDDNTTSLKKFIKQ